MVWSLENHLYLLILDRRAIVNLNCLATRLIALDIVKLYEICKKNTHELRFINFLIGDFFYLLTSRYDPFFLKQFKNNFKIFRELLTSSCRYMSSKVIITLLVLCKESNGVIEIYE